MHRTLTPLHCAADKIAMDCLEVLVKHNCMVCHCHPSPVVCTHLLKQINARDQSGQTALHRSAQQGLVNVCQFLLQHGADPLLVTRDGHSVADMANVSVLKLLQGQYDLYSLNHWPFPEQWYNVPLHTFNQFLIPVL